MSFWDKALGTTAAPARQQAPMAPAQVPWFQQVSLPTPQQQAQQYTPQPAPIPEAPAKAHSARSSARCPDCGSGNFFKPQGMPNAMEQCYHCGWNPRFSHSTAGAGMPSGDGAPATPARQISTANNYNPQVVVGHI